MRKVLWMDGGDGYTTMSMLMPLNCVFKMVDIKFYIVYISPQFLKLDDYFLKQNEEGMFTAVKWGEQANRSGCAKAQRDKSDRHS